MGQISKISLFLMLIMLVGFSACRKIEKYPPEPHIEYMDFIQLYNPDLEIYDRGVLKFSFEDGDGDIGLNSGDTNAPFNPASKYHYNLIITYFEMQNGVLTEVPILWFNPDTEQYDTLTLSARIPNLTPQGINKAINGEIQDTLFTYNFNSVYDTIMFEAYIIDRALNESNVINTPLFVR